MKHNLPLILVITALLSLFASKTGLADEAEITNLYIKKVKPLLTQRCVMCHGPLKQEGELRVDAGKFLLEPHEDRQLVVPGDSSKSLLIDAILGRNDASEMPMEGAPLTEQEKKSLIDWVNGGATYPEDEAVLEDPKDHWAFVPPVRPELPKVKNIGWGRNPIDQFIQAEYEKHNLQPVPELNKRLWLRRVTLDLIGLPPTASEVDAFVNNDSPDAHDQVIKKLLSRPEHGERWGRHWMDVWRYSDWYGYRDGLRYSGRHMWRWRDWIVDSINEGKPYSQMMMEMVAGDELDPGNREMARATGFLVRNYFKFNRNTWLEKTVEHTGKAFLGVTMNCARCHDHMYDPISQKEYYQFRAIFEPHKVRVDRSATQANTVLDGYSLAYDADLKTPTYLFEQGNEAHPVKEEPLPPLLPSLFADLTNFEVKPVALSTEAFYPGFRAEIREGILREAKSELSKATTQQQQFFSKHKKTFSEEAAKHHEAVHAQRMKTAELKVKKVTAIIQADIARYSSEPVAESKELIQAASQLQHQETLAASQLALLEADLALYTAQNSSEKDEKKKQAKIKAAQKKQTQANKNFTEAQKKQATADYTPLTPKYPTQSSGRRLAFAKWLADRNNPLTARVAVNHLWMRHFGKPLVPTTFDFGLNGKPASHPKLLDWLAVELMENNWNLKHIHQLMVSSQLYRLQADPGTDTANLTIDSDNIYFWRMNRRRAEAEAVRDSVLAVTGALERVYYGPELSGNQGETTYRRSIYYRHAPEKMMTFMEVFDAANTSECYERAVTIVPQQALALTNSRLSLELARRYTSQITNLEESREEFIGEIFETLISRAPEAEEQTTCLKFLEAQTSRLTNLDELTQIEGGPKPTVPAAENNEMRARENLVHVLFNHNEFVFIP